MPHQHFLVEGYDNPWALDIGFLGRDQVSLIRVFPFHQEHEFSTGVWAPIIHSGSKPQAKPCGFSGSFLLWFALLPHVVWIRISFALASIWFICLGCCFLWLQKLSSEVRAVRLSPDSHVSSSSETPFHFRRYSTWPFTTCLSRTFSTAYSSSSSTSSTFFLLVLFFPHSACQLSGVKGDSCSEQHPQTREESVRHYWPGEWWLWWST